MAKKALITGITGQDGSHLALLDLAASRGRGLNMAGRFQRDAAGSTAARA